MTTKYKIISGFLVMMLLLCTLTFVGYRSLNQATDRFVAYDRMAHLNVMLSDMYTSQYIAAYNIERFTITYDRAHIAEAQKQLDTMLALGEQALTYVTSKERVERITKSLADIKAYKKLVDLVQQEILEGRRLYNENFRSAAIAFSKQMISLADGGANAGNLQVLQLINPVWDATGLFRVNVAAYAEALRAENEQSADNSLKASKAAMAELDKAISSPSGRKDFAALTKTFDTFVEAFEALRRASQNALSNMKKTYELDLRIESVIREESATVNDEMLTYSKETFAAFDQVQQTTLLISVVGLIIGAVLAAFIIIGLIRALTRMADYANAVARGDFAYKPQIHEKGEIGVMMDALSKIPSILQTVVKYCTTTANHINEGKFRTRLHEEDFDGSFKDFATAVNAVAQAYTDVIDHLPVMVFTADMNRNVLYLNDSANTVMGRDALGACCGESINAELCKTDAACAGKNCISKNSTVSGEFTAYPSGERKEVSYSVTPLTDINNKVAGFMKVLTDITQIKDQQTTMQHVATEASHISDRVAAASEELSAQVEQISRGAELQKERVETTASAMTEMNATVLEVARSASQASEQSEETRKNAESGAQLVNKVVDSINKVNDVALKLQSNMAELGTMAESIGGVMNVISDIADQTNLLALNAAIEAARAGEAGRGFAVVADEVRKLAEKTMGATQEVGSSITAIQNSAQMNVTEVSSAVKSVNDATQLANSSGEALKDIVSLAGATSSVVTSIATAAEEQSAASEEITSAINEINSVVGETTEGMIQSSAAVQELSRMAQELKRVMEALR